MDIYMYSNRKLCTLSVIISHRSYACTKQTNNHAYIQTQVHPNTQIEPNARATHSRLNAIHFILPCASVDREDKCKHVYARTDTRAYGTQPIGRSATNTHALA